MNPKEEQKMQFTEEQIHAKKEKYYLRNFITLCLESFFFCAALAMFSAESVLPVYVENLSDKAIHIAMISVLYYGLSYGVYVFACPLGVNAKSPKWVSIGICFLQRIGIFLIFISTYAVSSSNQLALAVFFVSLALYALSNGMSMPLFSQMVSVSIHKNVGTFYGAYNLVGAASGVVGALIFTKCLEKYDFPKDYRMTFLVALIAALIATLVVSVGLKEVTDDRKPEKITLKGVFPISMRILKENGKFRHFVVIRLILGAAEFAIPYYIITAAAKEGAPAGFAGILATIFLVAKMISALAAGRIGDKFGPVAILVCSCSFGVLAALLAIVVTTWQMAILMYIFIAFATNGIAIATSTASVVYSHGRYVPIYSATISFLCAPLYIAVAFGGAAIASHFSYSVMFGLAFAVYLLGAVMSFYYLRKDKNAG